MREHRGRRCDRAVRTRRPRGRRACRPPARGRIAWAGLLAAVAAACVTASGSAIAAAASGGRSAGPASGGTWTVYHHDAAGTGAVNSVSSFDTSRRAWTSPGLDGHIYGEPLVSAGRVYVATENNTVYALSPATGRMIWSKHLGAPAPASSLPCGNITPTVGITGTPVIDPARQEIFVVADKLVNGRPTHYLVGLSTASGQVRMSVHVDPPGADTSALLQRTGLNLDAGQVIFGYGGNFGDCASYRGRVVAVPESGGIPRFFTVDAGRGQSQGAIWMGGAAPAVDSGGNIWVTAGNGSVHSASEPYDNSDSLLELSSSLQQVQFFAPSSWASDNAGDLDLSTAAALLPDGQVMFAGKSKIVYLLDRAHLGGIGGPHAELGSACGDDIDGGTAVRGTTVYLPCVSGVIAVRATQSPASVRRLWDSSTGGGPPIVAAGRVWTIGQDGVLYGLDPATGKVAQQASIGVPANHFPTPSVGHGLLLAASASNVIAFAAGGGSAASPGSPAGSPSGQAQPSGGGLSAGAIAGLTIAGLAVLAGLGWLAWHRRVNRTP